MTENIFKELETEASKCISCGFCESVCPTLPASGYSLSMGARGRVILGKELLKTSGKGQDMRSFFDSFYSCLDCFACLQVCPAGVNAGKVSQLSRSILVESGDRRSRDPVAEMIVRVTEKTMNPLGQGKQMARWSHGLKFDRDSKYLLYTGNMYQLMAYTKTLNRIRKRTGKRLSGTMAGIVSSIPSLSAAFRFQSDSGVADQMEKTLRGIYELLRKSGITPWYLGEKEPYPGTFIHDLGYSGAFRRYAEKVHGLLKSEGKTIIVIDPHTYDLLKNTYSETLESYSLKVVYYLDLIENLKIRKSNEKVVFHEPCHLVLRNPEYSAPKKILEKNFNLVLPRRSGKRTMCCGGPNELLFPDLSEKVSEKRFRDLESLNGDRIVTACPICYINLGKSIKNIELSDLILKNVE